jgi:tetratricopeptide (TPR) repeat protein
VRAAFKESLLGADLSAVASRTIDRHIISAAMSHLESTFPQEPLVRASVLGDLSKLCTKLGLHDRSIEAARLALDLRTEHLGTEDHQTLQARNNYGLALCSAGRWTEAEAVLRVVVEQRTRILGPNDLNTHTSAVNLADALSRMGRHAEAEPLLSAALVAFKSRPNPDDNNTEAALSHLAVCFDKGLDRREDAARLYREALALKRRLYGEDNATVWRAAMNLAGVLRKLGETAEAESLFGQATEGLCRTLGEDHPDAMIALSNFGSMLQASGRSEESLQYAERALAGLRRLRGNGHPAIVTLAYNVAYTKAQLGDHTGAEPLFDECLRGVDRHYAPASLERIRVRVHAGANLADLGRFREAVVPLREAEATLLQLAAPRPADSTLGPPPHSLHRRCLEALIRSEAALHGTDSVEVAAVRLELAMCLNRLKRPDDAVEQAQLALGVFDARLGPADPRTQEAAALLSEWRAQPKTDPNQPDAAGG